jgi:hypothetical protein
MQPFSIKYHKPGAGISPFSFYILSRGRNTGRPSFDPPVNSFAFTCAPQDIDHYYWLVWGLWKARRFYPYLRGSLIEFILIASLKQVIAEASRSLADIDRSISQLKKISAIEIKIKKQLQLIELTRRHLLQAV